MDDYRQANRRRWDELTPLHAGDSAAVFDPGAPRWMTMDKMHS